MKRCKHNPVSHKDANLMHHIFVRMMSNAKYDEADTIDYLSHIFRLSKKEIINILYSFNPPFYELSEGQNKKMMAMWNSISPNNKRTLVDIVYRLKRKNITNRVILRHLFNAGIDKSFGEWLLSRFVWE